MMTEQQKTLAKIEQAMRAWIEEQLPTYEQMPAAQAATTTQGEKVLKANPAVQEIRAAFRDYCYVIRAQAELSGGEAVDNDKITELRSRFKVAK